MASETGEKHGIQRDADGRPPFWQMRLETLKKHKESDFSVYPYAIQQIKKMAGGEDPEGDARQYYSDWTTDDFKWLLRELGEEVPE